MSILYYIPSIYSYMPGSSSESSSSIYLNLSFHKELGLLGLVGYM